jgi:hypothetical protein
MPQAPNIDRVVITWGDRVFYPGNRVVKVKWQPKLNGDSARQRAAREFAQIELAGHTYVMVLHDHQANPHVHISVRAEAKHGKRLNPRKADLHR